MKGVEPVLAASSRNRVAAIDVGSNSIHMLVVEIGADGKIIPIEAVKDQARLGAALDERLLLESSALTKASQSLRRMKDIAEGFNAKVRAIGTHVLREAKNGNEFCARLYKRSGVSVDIVSGHEEARLVYLGVRYGLAIDNRSVLLVDIGGGSTELLVGQWGEERFSTSLKLGAVRLTQKFLKSDPVTDEDLAGMRKYIETRLEPVIGEIRKIGFEMAIGSSGTIKAIKALVLGLQGKPLPESFHGSVLTSSEITFALEQMDKRRALKDRRALPGMDAKRADIIVAGAYILEAITRMAGISAWTISLTAIREGIVIDTLMREGEWAKGNPSDVRWRSVRAFGQKLEIDESHAWHISSLAISLFEQMQHKHGMSAGWREYLRCGAHLHECGKFLGFTGYHKHAFYLIRNAALLGFSLRELDYIASIVRFHRKRGPRDSDDVYSGLEPTDRTSVTLCAALLRLAVSLDRGRLGKIQEVQVQELGRICRLTVFLHGSRDVFLEMYEASLEKRYFEEAFDVSLEIEVSNFINQT